MFIEVEIENMFIEVGRAIQLYHLRPFLSLATVASLVYRFIAHTEYVYRSWDWEYVYRVWSSNPTKSPKTFSFFSHGCLLGLPIHRPHSPAGSSRVSQVHRQRHPYTAHQLDSGRLPSSSLAQVRALSFGILIWKHVGTQKISTQSSKLVVSRRSLYASPEVGDA